MEGKKFVIPKPEPCNENWDAMEVVPGGRHCAACAHNLIDFTVLSDEQIINLLKKIGDKPYCGRFAMDQLDRELVQVKPRRSFPVMQKIAAGLIIAQTFAIQAFAQKAKPRIHHMQKKATTDGKRKISGMLLDHSSKQPVGGITIKLMIEDSVYAKTITAQSGHFELLIPKDSSVQEWTISGVVEAKMASSYIIPEINVKAQDLQLRKQVTIYGYPMHSVTQEISEEKYRRIVTTMGIPPRHWTRAC